MSKANVKSGQQGTDRPWERPGQSSQDLSIEPPRRKDREGRFEVPANRDGESRPVPDWLRNASSTIRRIENRVTEDDLAQAALGGPKGSAELPPAPLTKTEKEQNSPNDDPGHVA